MKRRACGVFVLTAFLFVSMFAWSVNSAEAGFWSRLRCCPCRVGVVFNTNQENEIAQWAQDIYKLISLLPTVFASFEGLAFDAIHGIGIDLDFIDDITDFLDTIDDVVEKGKSAISSALKNGGTEPASSASSTVFYSGSSGSSPSSKASGIAGGGFLGTGGKGILAGLPIKDRKAEKIVEETEEKNTGTGGWFGYGLQIREVRYTKEESRGAQILRKIKEGGGAIVEKLDPGILPSDFKAMSSAVFQAALQSAREAREKEHPGIPAGSVRALTFEAVMETRNDNIKALSRITWPVYDESEKERRTESVKSVGTLPFVDVIAPSESFHAIAQNLSAIISLRAEVMENTSKIIDLKARKVVLLGRLAAMEGEKYTMAMYEKMAAQAMTFSNTLDVQSTYRGR